MKSKVDYTVISEQYDETRVPLIQDTLEFCLSKLIDLGKISAGSLVLDVGCGTGIYTMPLAEKTGALVFGLDTSREMIKKAKVKRDSQKVEWLVGDAENPPFDSARFDCVVMTLVIHQIADKKKAVRGVYRVLKNGGSFVIMTKSHGQLERSLITGFPKVRQIDLERFPAVPVLRKILQRAGFEKARYQAVSAGTTTVPLEDYLEKVRKKFISTLTLLSEEDFCEGFKIFEEKLRKKWGTRGKCNIISYEKEYTFVSAQK